MIKKISIICIGMLLIGVCFAFGFYVAKTKAVGPIAFGGRLTQVKFCNCSASYWLFYAPLPDSSFPGGPLSYVPYATKVYSFYKMTTPGVWHLGTYLPGVQSCWVAVHHGCLPLPVLGQEVMVGTSAR